MLDPQPDSPNREETRTRVAVLPPLTLLPPSVYLPGTGPGTSPAKPAPPLKTDGKAPAGRPRGEHPPALCLRSIPANHRSLARRLSWDQPQDESPRHFPSCVTGSIPVL